MWGLSVMGGLLGGLFFLVSRWTKEAFGYGDSCIITILGIQAGLWNLLSILWGAFFAAAVFAVFASIKGSWNRKTAFPFVPFLTLAYVGVWIL